MKKFVTFISVLAALVFAGCSTKKTAENGEGVVSLKNIVGEWTVESMTGFENEKVIPAMISINPDTESETSDMYLISGNSGVNTFFADIKDENPFPLTEQLAMTKMMGSPDEMAFEDAFIEILTASDKWTLDNDGKLVIENQNNSIILKK